MGARVCGPARADNSRVLSGNREAGEEYDTGGGEKSYDWRGKKFVFRELWRRRHEGRSAPHHTGKSRTISCFAADFGDPPADADEQKSPVVEKLGRLAFEGVAYELEDPSQEEECKRCHPQMVVEKNSGCKNGQRYEDQRNAEGVADAIDRVLVTGRVLRDPLLGGAVA